MFEEFYEMYEPEEQEVVALINRCIGGGYNWKGNFWEMTVVTLGVVFCDTGKVSTKEERLEWPVTDEERNSEKGWERFQNEQICRLKIRRMKEEVGTHAYVNPVVAVVIGGGLGGEQITGIQLLGLVIILGSVMLVNKKERINE